MRQIEAQMVRALKKECNWKSGNTKVSYNPELKTFDVQLHNTVVVRYNPENDRIILCNGGYRTNTTKSRINAALSALRPGCGVFQRSYAWFVRTPQKTEEWSSDTFAL